MRLTRCRLRHCRCLLYGASVKLLEPWTLMRHSGVTLLSGYILCCFLLAPCFSPPVCITVTKSATSEDRTHGLTIMRLTKCRLRHCRCLRYCASVKLLEPCTLMRRSGVTMLSGYTLCCFWLALVFRPQYVLPWQKVRQVRIELSTLRLWGLRAADCAIVSAFVMVHQWSNGALYVDAAFRNKTVVKLSFVLLLVGFCFFLQPVLLWQKVRQLRMELTTLRLWDLRAADCAIVAVSVMVHQWSYWNLVRWCGIPE